MTQYLIVIEKTSTGYSAYSPDVLGCVATGKTREEVEYNMKGALEFHLEGFIEEYKSIPPSESYSKYLELAV